MNKILLISVSVLGLFLSSEAYCTCKPLSVPTCKCQFPVYDGKNLTCGDDYCAKNGKTCMPDGSCCKVDKVCGSELSPYCCSDTQTCVNETTCCSTETPYLNENGLCVQCTEDAHCTNEGETCDETNECVEKNIETLCAEAGGTEITNTAGTTFCMSNVKLNWWSAANWCKANGMHLATMYEMCPSWDGNTGGNKCPELNGKGSENVWSSTVRGSDYAFLVKLYDGGVYDTGLRNGSYGPAFCR